MHFGNRVRTRPMSVNSSVPADPASPGADEAASVPQHSYAKAELARHDGTDPASPVLIAYKGKVYDVTSSFPWARGRHWGNIRAGQDLTGRMKDSIHGEEMLDRIPCVGVLED